MLSLIRAAAIFCAQMAFVTFLAGWFSVLLDGFLMLVHGGHYFWAAALFPVVLCFAASTIAAIVYLHPPYHYDLDW